MNNAGGVLIYSKCRGGENSVGFRGNSQNNNNMATSNVNNITSADFSGGGSVGVMNNNTNNSEVSSLPSYTNADAVGVTFCNNSGNVGFHNAFHNESSKSCADDKYISEISKSNILRHENNHYLSHRQHPSDHYLHHRSSGPRHDSEQFINSRKERREDGDELMHKLNQRGIIL